MTRRTEYDEPFQVRDQLVYIPMHYVPLPLGSQELACAITSKLVAIREELNSWQQLLYTNECAIQRQLEYEYATTVHNELGDPAPGQGDDEN